MKKKGNKKMPTPRHSHSPKTTTYILMQAIGCQGVVQFALPNAFITNKQTNNPNKNVGIGL